MASQDSLKVLATSPPQDPEMCIPAPDPRWLLSCKYGIVDIAKDAKCIERLAAIVQMLGAKDVVSNPNRFSKSCCTVGHTWDDNYNKGDNAEKYLRCWEPDAPEELRCTKPVLDGQEPTKMTCWKSSYFWRLKKCRKMLRIIESTSKKRANPSYELGEGQIIEKRMAEYLQREDEGCEVRCLYVNCPSDPDQVTALRWYFLRSSACFTDEVPVGHFLHALNHAPELAKLGFGSPIIMMVKIIQFFDKSVCDFSFMAARLFELQENDGYLDSDFYKMLHSELKFESSVKTILSDLEAIHKLSELETARIPDDWEELITHPCCCAHIGMLMVWVLWRWYQEKAVGLASDAVDYSVDEIFELAGFRRRPLLDGCLNKLDRVRDRVKDMAQRHPFLALLLVKSILIAAYKYDL